MRKRVTDGGGGVLIGLRCSWYRCVVRNEQWCNSWSGCGGGTSLELEVWDGPFLGRRGVVEAPA